MIPPEVLCALADLYEVSVDYLPERTEEKLPDRERQNIHR